MLSEDKVRSVNTGKGLSDLCLEAIPFLILRLKWRERE